MRRSHRSTDWPAAFLQSLKSEMGYSDHTIASYGFDLEQFGRHLSRPLLTATSRDIAKFIAQRLESGISPMSARRQHAAIRSFYYFVVNEGGIKGNPTRFLRAPKAHRPIIRRINLEEIESLLAAIGTEKALDLRDRALILTAYGSGLRVSELAHLRMSDIDFVHAVAKVRLGKGRKDRLVPLNAREIEALRIYLGKGRPRLAADPDNERLFIGGHGNGKRGRPLTRQRIWQVFAGISRQTLKRCVSPHKFRHAFVTDTINGGAEPRTVQAMAGHANFSTTMGYMHTDLERIRTHYLKSHPRAIEDDTNATHH
jgi:integrase/recombinase XerD